MTYTSISAGTNFSAFAFIRTTNATTAASLILWVNGGATNQILVATAGPRQACFDGTHQPTSNIIDEFTAFSLVGVVCTAGACVFYQNGVSVGVGGVNVTALTVTNFGAATSFFSTFDCTESVFYTAALTASQISLLTEYFRAKSPF